MEDLKIECEIGGECLFIDDSETVEIETEDSFIDVAPSDVKRIRDWCDQWLKERGDEPLTQPTTVE